MYVLLYPLKATINGIEYCSSNLIDIIIYNYSRCHILGIIFLEETIEISKNSNEAKLENRD